MPSSFLAQSWKSVVVLAAVLSFPRPVLGEQGNENLWGTDGTVIALARVGSTLYVGGSFTQAGPLSGGAVSISPSSGEPVAPFPRVTGTVSALVDDGSGGWYIGGAFVAVGGQPRSNLAHVLRDGSVAPWNPQADGEVLALARADQVVYVGGYFSSLAGQTRHYVGGLDATTGQPTAWQPEADLQVRTILVSAGGRIFVGGDFHSIGGQPRNYVAELDPVSAHATAWNPDIGPASSSVRALASAGDSLILIGGLFWSVGSETRHHLAAVDTATGLPTSWDPNLTGPDDLYFGDPYVRALAVRGSAAYVGGHFTGIGGQARTGLAAIDLTTGIASSWDPGVRDVVCMALAESTLYVGGYFTSVDVVGKNSLAEISLTSGLPTAWTPNPNNVVKAVGFTSTSVVAGGFFTGLGSQWQARTNLAAFDLTTGALKNWDPHPDGLGVWSLAVHGAQIYVGGYFNLIGGQVRTALAALDTLSGAATSWDPEGDNIITTLAVSGDTLYAGGLFSSMSGQPRSRLASFDLTTSTLTSWDPGANSDVFGLAISGRTIYVAGFFSTIAGVSRRYGLAAIDASTGVARDWNPQSDNWVNAVAVYRDAIYVGGRFNMIGGQLRSNLAALDPITGQATPWTCDANSEVFALTPIADRLVVGGRFFVIGGQPRNGLAAVDVVTGTVLPWDPGLGIAEWLGAGSYPNIYALLVADNTLYVGGAFRRLDDIPVGNLAGILLGPPLPGGPPPTKLALAPLWPNPVRQSATIRFALPRAGPVTLTVFDLQGRRMASLLDHVVRPAGVSEVTFQPAAWREGFYFCRLEAGGASATRKFVLID